MITKIAAVSNGHYDHDQANSYEEAKGAAFRDRIELYTTLQLVGPLHGKRVIDVACGYGWLTRELYQQNNASYVLGTDLSSEMIQLAQKQQQQQQEQSNDPIQFQVEDIRHATPAEFDVVASNWLLVNAQNRSDLASMCRGLARKTKSGGKLVTIVTNPDLYESYSRQDEINNKLKRYGLTASLPRKAKEGSSLTFHLLEPSGEPLMDIVNYYHSRQTLREELEAAGFCNVQIIDQLLLSPDKDDAEEWKDFLACPTFVAITATKM